MLITPEPGIMSTIKIRNKKGGSFHFEAVYVDVYVAEKNASRLVGNPIYDSLTKMVQVTMILAGTNCFNFCQAVNIIGLDHLDALSKSMVETLT